MKSGLLIVLLGMLFLSTQVSAVLKTAQPPIQHFSPDLEVYPQNFSIAVDHDFRVFIGNTDGVLVFDGEYWQLVALPNKDIVRWLQYDQQQRVYVGGYDSFGFIEQDQFGDFKFTDLTSKFTEQLNGDLFADIWRISSTAEGVFFVALKHLFFYNPETEEVKFWKHPGSFGPISYFQGQVLLQWRGEGLKAYKNGSWQLIPGADLSKIYLADMVALEDELILVASEEDWYRFDGEQFSPMPETGSLPYGGSITWAFKSNSTTLGLTTQLGLLVFYDVDKQKSSVVKVSNGFVSGAVQTQDGTVLTVDDLGFTALRWPARWRRIDSRSGLAGTISKVVNLGASIYAMSSSGVFMASADDVSFERLAFTDYEAWDLLPLQDGSMLFADSYEIKWIQADGKIITVDPNTTARVFKQSRFDSNIVYVGTEFGIQVLQKQANGWVSVLRDDKMDNLRITQIIERAPGEIWVGSERGGIRQISFKPAEQWTMIEKKILPESGIDYGDIGKGAYLYEFDGQIIASTSKGIFRWLGEKFSADDFLGLDSLLVEGRVIELAKHHDTYWAFYFDRVFQYDKGWQEQALGGLRQGAIDSIQQVGKSTVLGLQGSIIVLDEAAVETDSNSPGIRLSGASYLVNNGPEGQVHALPLNNVKVGSAVQRLTLQYAVPEFAEPDAVRYRTRLLPTETLLSSWSSSSEQTLLDLDPGHYQFEIEARDSLGRITHSSVPVTVVPQWFQTNIFKLVLAGLLLLACYFAIVILASRRSRNLAAERDRLEAMVAQRTRALQSANKQLDKMAHLDGLTQIPNRRRLDSYLEDVRRQCIEHDRVMSMAIIDIDLFKQYNDTHGHPAGDKLLVNLAKLLSRNLRRAEDLVARYGGEEFLVVLPGADRGLALQIVEDMRASVENSDLKVTISVGVHVNLPNKKTTVIQMIEAADKALYQAKESGRNKVCEG